MIKLDFETGEGTCSIHAVTCCWVSNCQNLQFLYSYFIPKVYSCLNLVWNLVLLSVLFLFGRNNYRYSWQAVWKRFADLDVYWIGPVYFRHLFFLVCLLVEHLSVLRLYCCCIIVLFMMNVLSRVFVPLALSLLRGAFCRSFVQWISHVGKPFTLQIFLSCLGQLLQRSGLQNYKPKGSICVSEHID